MGEELKPCPFCNGTHSINVINFFTRDSFRKCDICGAEAPEAKTPEEAAEKWNNRPAEDALKAEVEELRYIVEQFSKWTAEGGCVKANHPDFPCWWERNRVELELDDYCDDDDEREHKCWVEYYRWKYRQKLNSAIAEERGRG